MPGRFRGRTLRDNSEGWRGDEWDWLHHNIRYNKPLIWWSICSHTSSSVIHPPVRHHRGSGAAQEPDRVNCFLHVHLITQRLCVHQPVHLCSLPFQMRLSALWTNPADVSSVDEALDVRDDTFYLTSKTRDKAERSVLVSKLDRIQLPVNMCFPLYRHFLAFCYSASICFV